MLKLACWTSAFVALGFLAGCGEPRIDGSSDEAFTASMQAMVREIDSDADKHKFVTATFVLTLLADPALATVDGEEFKAASHKALDGMTAKEILTAAAGEPTLFNLILQRTMSNAMGLGEAPPTKATGKLKGTPPGKDPWLCPSEPITLTHARLTVESIKIAPVRVEGYSGERLLDTKLQIRIRIDNTSTTKKIDFYGWSSREVTMVDNYDNDYSLRYSASDDIVGAECGSIYPGESATDILAFALPVSAMKYLKLKLSGYPLDEKDPIRIRFPASMIETIKIDTVAK